MHVSSPRTAHQAARNPARAYPERDPRKALLLLQHTDTWRELKNAEEQLFALNARKGHSDADQVVEEFVDVWTTITRCRNKIQEIRHELGGGGGAGPSDAGPSIAVSRAADRSVAGRGTAGLGDRGSAGASTSSDSSARLSRGRQSSNSPQK